MSDYLGMTRTLLLRLKSEQLIANQIWEFCYLGYCNNNNNHNNKNNNNSNNNNNNNNIDSNKRNASVKMIKKLSKYEDLEMEISRTRGLKTETVPVFIGAFGLVEKGLGKYIETSGPTWLRQSLETSIYSRRSQPIFYEKCSLPTR